MILRNFQLLFLILIISLLNQVNGQNKSTCQVYFTSNSYKLTSVENAKLKTFIAPHITRQNIQISIIGYCDDAGNEKYNDTLSLQRANQVRNILLSSGINKNIIRILIGKGEIPILDAKKKSVVIQRNLNRRVEVEVTLESKEPINKKSLLSDDLDIGDHITLEGVLFLGGRSTLIPESISVLDSLTLILKQKKEYYILLKGHVHNPMRNNLDAPDTDTGLDNLSVARAKKIYDHFVANGIPASRLSYVGLKGLYPVCVCPDGKYNRRVEIQIKKISILDKNNAWQQLIERNKRHNQLIESKFNKGLIAKLDSMLKDDQQARQQLESIEEKQGWDSKELMAQWEIIAKKDSLNLLKVKVILSKYGWPGPEVIGYKGSVTLFLVIQHAPLKEQEKFLPMLREAVKNKYISPSSLALLEDRVALQQGKRQIYGSQIERDELKKIYFVSPLVDPDHVDQRRASVGLDPIASYISNWGIKWDIVKYKKDMRLMEGKIKNK